MNIQTDSFVDNIRPYKLSIHYPTFSKNKTLNPITFNYLSCTKLLKITEKLTKNY